jgi:starch phosphorylase
MKFVMNGCLILGTMDGANVEIAEEIGKENMFIFGKNVDEVDVARKEMYGGKRDYVGKRLARVFEVIKSGQFAGNTAAFRELIGNLEGGKDHYLVSHDFYSYLDAQE